MEGNREVFFMKKKLSRLLCALLVMTMVLAMVPAVSAAGTDGESSAANPIVMYVDDAIRADEFRDFECTAHPKASATTTCTLVDDKDREISSRGSYVSYSGGYITAKSTTLTVKNGAVEENVAKFTMKCSTSNCTTTPVTRYYKVYSKATGITLKKSPNGTTLNDTLNVSGTTKVYYTITPTTTNPEKVTAEIDNTSVATVSGPQTDKDRNSYFEITSKGGSASTKLTVTADAGTGHTPISKELTIITGSAGILYVKNNNKIVAQSNYKPSEYTTIYANIGDKITLTADLDPTLGNIADVDWECYDTVKGANGENTSNTATLTTKTKKGSATFQVLGSGQATITAVLDGTRATVKLSVLSDITKVRAATTDGNIIESKDLKINEELVVKAVVTPNRYEIDSAPYAVWSTSDSDVVDFNKTRRDSFTVDPDTGEATGAQVRLLAKNSGKATIKVTLGEVSYSFTVNVAKPTAVIKITSIPITTMRATVRTGTRSEIVARMNANSLYTSISAKASDSAGDYVTPVPVEWYDAEVASDGKSAKARGNAMTTDGQNTYEYDCSTAVTANVTLTDEAAVTDITVTGNKDNAIENDVVRLTANATVEPSSADVKYQWYANGKAISGATKRTVSYTIPKSSVDSSTEYKFTCEVTATYKGSSTSVESKPFVVTVSRDYTVSVTATSAKTSYTVGDKVEMKATLYYKGSAVSNSSFSWQLFDTNENVLDSGIATITGNNATATVTTKGVKNAKGDKIVVRATVDYRGYSYSSSETITVNPAEAATVKQSVGSGATLKSSSITAAVTRAAGSGTKVSYLIFNTPKSCKLTKSSSSSSSLGDTKCYVSSSSGQKLSDVYVKTSASSASVTYTAYDADDYVLATGTVSFDANDSDDTITSSGASFKAMAAVDQITEEYPEAEYVKLDLPRASEGKLYYDFNTISDFASEVKDSDKYYVNASSSQADVEDVYFLPVYGVKGKITIDYTAYGSNNSDLGTGKITLSVKSKTASSKFTDVTASNVGSWAADSIDFCADNDLVNGKSTYSFAPKDNLTRGQLVAILYRAAGSPSVTGTTNPFNDVKTGDYYYNAVLWAYKNDVVNGTGAGKFSPNANVTREQIAAILYRYMGSPAATGSLSGYTDRSKISSWATTAMQWAIGKGYITGTSSTTLDPLGQATRAQAAVMLHRFLTK